MALVPWRKRQGSGAGDSTETPLTQFRGEMENLFDRFFRDPFNSLGAESPLAAFRGFPRTDLAESDSDVTVTMEIPGLDPKDIEIDVAGGLLTVRGEKKQEHEEKRRDYHFVERQFGSFHRSVRLPGSADPDRVDAKFKDGVLTITVAKQPGARPKKITVKTA